MLVRAVSQVMHLGGAGSAVAGVAVALEDVGSEVAPAALRSLSPASAVVGCVDYAVLGAVGLGHGYATSRVAGFLNEESVSAWPGRVGGVAFFGPVARW